MANLESPMNLTCCGEVLEEAEVPEKKKPLEVQGGHANVTKERPQLGFQTKNLIGVRHQC